jgi:hypothetical protein
LHACFAFVPLLHCRISIPSWFLACLGKSFGAADCCFPYHGIIYFTVELRKPGY